MFEVLFGGLSPWFTAPALLGTGYLLLQLILGQIGGDLNADGVADIDDPGAEGRWLSIQTVAAFLVGFGWIGLAAFRFTDLHFLAAATAGLAAGSGVAWIMVALTRQVVRLQSSGNLRLKDTVGKEAPVYVLIPPDGGGTGRITVVIHNSQHEISARQHGTEAIATNTLVRIIEADAATGTVVVKPA